MKRLGQFFRKQLEKYFLSSPQVSDETQQRRGINFDAQGPSSEPLDESIVNDSSLSNTLSVVTDVTVEPTSKDRRLSSELSKEHATPYHTQVKKLKNENLGLAVAFDDGNQPVDKNKANLAIQNLLVVEGPRKTKCNPNTADTGITETVLPPLPSSQCPLTESNCGIKISTSLQIPIRVSAPNQPGQFKPENELGSVHKSSQQGELAHTGQVKDMVSESQHGLSLASHKIQQLPSNSTTLRNYLENTSTRRSSSQKQAASPNKTPLVPYKHSSTSGSPRQESLRHPQLTEKRSAPTIIRPSSSKKNYATIVPKYEPRDAAESSSTVNQKNEEVVDKNPEISSSPIEDVSVITLIEVSDSTKEVVGSVCRKFGMKPLTSEGYWNVRWSDHGVSIQLCQKLHKYQRINRFPGSGLLMTKNNLAKNTNKMRQTFPEDYDFVPETWCLPGEISKVEQYAKAHDHDCFIVKPNDGSSGKGIIITRNIARLKMCNKMVCQVYIRRPFLIDGYKFDLRIYALISSCRPLRLFVYNEGLARFATEQYEEPNQHNESNRYMHLTNYAVNKRSPLYTVDETKGTLRRLTTINKWLLRHNIDAKKVCESMDDAIIKTIISFLPALRHNYKVSFPDQNDSNSCFQMLGFDIIFDYSLKPFVLEVNDSPSFKADVPLDKEMTEALIHDTFNILHLDENNRSKVLMEEKRQSRMRLLSSSSQNRNAIHKEKEQNERLLTQSRIEWENAHMGNFRKVFPNDKMKHYRKFIKASQDIFISHS